MERTNVILAVIVVIGLISVVPIYYLLFDAGSSINSITLATTTSTDNSGLLDYLQDEMKKDLPNLHIDVVPVGTGQALENARLGEADVVMVHARSLEDQFVGEGYGIHRVDLMYNDFVIVGPADDPAHVKDAINATDAFLKLYQARNDIVFYTRGDNSGTNVKELSIWNATKIYVNSSDINWSNNNQWYQETGVGMGSTLTTTSITPNAYTLSDRATYLSSNSTGSIDLKIVYESVGSDQELLNPYGAILVNPDKFPDGHIKFDLAKEYVEWLITKGQDVINSYKLYNQQLFHASFNAHLSEMSTSELQFWGLNT